MARKDYSEDEFKAEPKAAEPAKRPSYKVLVALSYNKDGAYTPAKPGEIIELTDKAAAAFLAAGAIAPAK